MLTLCLSSTLDRVVVSAAPSRWPNCRRGPSSSARTRRRCPSSSRCLFRVRRERGTEEGREGRCLSGGSLATSSSSPTLSCPVACALHSPTLRLCNGPAAYCCSVRFLSDSSRAARWLASLGPPRGRLALAVVHVPLLPLEPALLSFLLTLALVSPSRFGDSGSRRLASCPAVWAPCAFVGARSPRCLHAGHRIALGETGGDG